MHLHNKYPNLFSPLKINSVILKNRIFYAPVEAYWDRAISGCAVMMRGTSGTLQDPRCRIKAGPWLFSASEMSRTVDELSVLKRGGALAELEVMHAGIGAFVPEGDYVVGPSDGIRADGTRIRGMTREMMEQVINEFTETCIAAKRIGYDMVMLHYAHGWLPSQFLAPGINHRTDEFGGCFENRARFPKMILKAVRKALGPTYPIDMRISASEAFEGCASEDEVIQFIKEVSDEGLIDVVNVSYGGHFAQNDNFQGAPSSFYPDMCFADYAARIREKVSVPVVVVGKIMTPDEAESILAEGKADAVVIGRASIADPMWANKAFEDRAEDIIPCISCGKCFDKRCPVQLRNYQWDKVPAKLEKAHVSKKIVIVGGGPAGMIAAITAAQRGHTVVLFEKSNNLGGLLRYLDSDENKRELQRYKKYLIRQVQKADITVRMNTEATQELIEKENPDQLILALGSLPASLKIKGSENAMQILDAHTSEDKLGKRVVIIGGGLVGSEFACTLALRGHEVTILEIAKGIGGQFSSATFRPYQLLSSMENVHLLDETRTQEIFKDHVTVLSKDNETIDIPADNVLISVGFVSNREDIERYYGIVPDTIMIGDVRRPANIRECNEEGYFAAAGI